MLLINRDDRLLHLLKREGLEETVKQVVDLSQLLRSCVRHFFSKSLLGAEPYLLCHSVQRLCHLRFRMHQVEELQNVGLIRDIGSAGLLRRTRDRSRKREAKNRSNKKLRHIRSPSRVDQII